MNHFSRAFWTVILILLSLPSHAEVEPPNYDFSLDQFKVFMPGEDLKKALENRESKNVLNSKGAYVIHRIFVEHLRYKFPVLIQSNKGKITDFYARLPAYFLHDIFHQSLINRIGPQDIYRKKEEQAVYAWKNKNNLNHVYSGACSITCFPVYYTVFPEKNEYKAYKPIIKQMASQEFLKDSNL